MFCLRPSGSDVSTDEGHRPSTVLIFIGSVLDIIEISGFVRQSFQKESALEGYR